MKKLSVFFNKTKAGHLIKESDNSYLYSYLPEYLADDKNPSIAFEFPKTSKPYCAKKLFPFFFNMLPEGKNKDIICRSKGIDKDDDFELLIATADLDRIGAISLKEDLQ